MLPEDVLIQADCAFIPSETILFLRLIAYIQVYLLILVSCVTAVCYPDEWKQ